jgi:hypothetical protein
MALGPETLEELRRTVARFVDERLIPSEKRVEEEERVPPEIVAEMKALGLFGLTIPEEYGGLGLAMAEEFSFVTSGHDKECHSSCRHPGESRDPSPITHCRRDGIRLSPE